MAMSVEDILDSRRTRTPVIMGIVNVTPDSFSDGGDFLAPADAIAHGRELFEAGADCLDVGAESTRPGSRPVAPDEQIRRLEPVVPELVALGAPISVDTTSAAVARFALDAGAQIVNDTSAGRDDPELLGLVASRGAAVVLMHRLGAPRTMQDNPEYEDVLAEVRHFLDQRIADAREAGIADARIVVDPGIGFGKRLEHNLALLGGSGRLAEPDRCVLVGPSRKRFIGELTGRDDPARRLHGTIAACLEAWNNQATIFRVHDVAPLSDALDVAIAIQRAGATPSSHQ